MLNRDGLQSHIHSEVPTQNSVACLCPWFLGVNDTKTCFVCFEELCLKKT